MILSRQDTIVALATPSGTGAIAVIRISGSESFRIMDEVFSNRMKGKSKDFPSHTVHLGIIKDGENKIDEVLATFFRGPNSYTGENVVEISCHGSTFIQHQILQLILGKGARMAQPGEFTLRAFLNGKMDLSQAEAVADLIASDSSASHDLAMQQMRGGYSSEMKQLRDQLIQFASLIELELDFSEEDVEFADRNALIGLVHKIREKIDGLISSFELGNVIKQGIPVVIAGKPNVGKSTLLNALLNEERAIVSHLAGTTRDTIEEELVLGGIKFRFIDTAGLRQTTDAIESIGVNRTMEKISQSPVLVYLFDLSETTSAGLQQELDELKNNLEDTRYRLILAGNKLDTQRLDEIKKEFQKFPDAVFLSAKEKINLEAISKKLLAQVHSGELKPENIVVTNARHVEALRATHTSLGSVLEGLEKKLSGDLLAPDLRNTLYHLGLITGEVTTDTLLENIFSKFCIGK